VVTIAAKPDRDQVGNVLEQRPPTDRAHQAPVIELAGEPAGVEVMVRQTREEGVGAVQDERRVAADERTSDPGRDQKDECPDGGDE
jgi:hypothetical protein